jgi:DNA-binding MarR family transcriptional regulator
MELSAEQQTVAVAEAWQLLQRIMVGQRGRMATIAAELELAPAQMFALHALEPGQPKAMSELAQTLRCDNSNVTGIIDRLEARGLVERRPGERDRRVKMLEVTPAGAQLREQIRRRLSLPPEPLASLQAEDACALRDILRRALAD